MTGPVTFGKNGRIGVITVDNPPVNALSQAVRQGLIDCLADGLADDEVEAMVLIGAGRTFIAGADIREFGQPPKEPDLNSVIRRYEEAGKPVVAAIHGTALGGGLETAFGCHYRVAVEAARVGLPEVKLGIIPGAGGTQRLPRVAGVEAALGMITTGDMVPAKVAVELGIVDKIVDDLAAGAVAFAERLVDHKMPLRRIRDDRGKLDDANEPVFDEYRQRLARSARGFNAPQKAVDAVEAAYKLPFDQSLARERELINECFADPQSRAQIHAFFGEREVAKIPGIDKETSIATVKKAAVIGAGTMGGGIAMNFANAGIPVTVLETDQEPLDRGLDVVRGNYANTVARGRLDQAAMDKRLGLIKTSLDYKDIADADIVMEAVFEEMDIKHEVFGKLDQTMKAGAILATNTSTLDIDEIARATGRPEAVIGTHFFSPANVMRLLEVVRGAKTSNEAIASCMTLAKTIGKVAVLAGNCDGFIGNRMLDPYLRQAVFLLEEGALPQDVDRVLYEFGLAMGPFAMSDLAGNDVGWRIRQRKLKDWPANKRYSTLPDKICEQGRFGQKTGKGWYLYEAGSRAPKPDPAVETLIVEHSKADSIPRRKVSDDEILQRCLYALINEGAQILDEGIALRAVDIDITYLYGYGFPRYRGGPMFYADQVGLGAVYKTIVEFHERFGDDWAPAPLLKRLAAEGKGFGDL